MAGNASALWKCISGLKNSPELLKCNERVLRPVRKGIRYKPPQRFIRLGRYWNKQKPDAIVMDIGLPDGNGLDFCRINFSIFIQDGLVCKYTYDFANYMEAIYLIFCLYNLTLQRKWKFIYNRCVNLLAFNSGQSAAFKFISHFIASCDTKEISSLNMWNIRNTQSKSAALQDILRCFMVFANIQRNHVVRTDAAPGHVHNIDCIVITVSGNFEETGFSYTLSLISGKYKMVILYCLMEFETVRFNELQRYLRKISDKTLSQNLKELAADGLICKNAYPQIPPKVEYSLSEKGKSLMHVLDQLCVWGEEHRGG